MILRRNENPSKPELAVFEKFEDAVSEFGELVAGEVVTGEVAFGGAEVGGVVVGGLEGRLRGEMAGGSRPFVGEEEMWWLRCLLKLVV